MRPKHLLILLFLFLFACSESQENLSSRISEFYKYYIIEEFENDKEVSVDTMARYFTKRFLHSSRADADKYDWNPVTQTQDYNIGMLETLKLKRMSQRQHLLYYELTFIDEFDNSKHGRVLVLKMEREAWKIDTIINNDNGQFLLPE